MIKTYERDFKMKVVQEINAKKATLKAVSDKCSIARPISLVGYQNTVGMEKSFYWKRKNAA